MTEAGRRTNTLVAVSAPPTRGGLNRFLRSRLIDPFRRAYKSRATPKHLVLRSLALGIVLVMAHLWLLLNQGFPYVQLGISSLATVLAVILQAFKPEFLKGKIRHTLNFLLRTPMLLTAAVLFIAVSLFWSSVQVTAGGVEDRAGLRLAVMPAADLADVASPGRPRSGGRALYGGGNDKVRFRTFTTPWGRRYAITIEGCPAVDFTLLPWKPSSFHVTEVLDECPSLLLRIPAELHSVLAGGKMKVHDEKGLIAEALIERDHGAILLGRNIPVPDDLESLWKTDLEASGLVGRKAISNWKRPIHVVPMRDLRPKMLLSAAFETRAGVVLANRQYVVLGKRRIEDVPLLGVR